MEDKEKRKLCVHMFNTAIALLLFANAHEIATLRFAKFAVALTFTLSFVAPAVIETTFSV